MPDRSRAYDGTVRIGHTAQGVPFVRLYLGTSPVTGRRIRPYKAFPGMSDDEAQSAAERWAAEVTGTVRDGMTRSVRDMLTRHVDRMEAMHRSANTIKTYRLYVRRYVAPISKMLVAEVTTEDVDDLLVWLLSKGPDGRPVSPMTARNFRFFLEGAFARWKRLGIVEANPVADSIRPEADRKEAVALDDETAARLVRELDAVMAGAGGRKGDRMERCAAFAAVLSLSTGLRCGEVCALRNEDVHMDEGCIVVSGTVVEDGGRVRRQERTKGKRTRTVAMTGTLLDALRTHRAWQSTYAGDGRGAPLVSADGRFMRPSYVSRKFSELRRRIGLDPRITFHTLRHTHATWLLQDGMNIRDIQERLGHAYVDTTLATYGHVLPGRDELAARRFDDDLRRIRHESVRGNGG
jgi:integrase